MIDTHCHIDGEEFAQDLEEVITRARGLGCRPLACLESILSHVSV